MRKHDAALQAEVEAELNADPRLRPGQIGVSVQDGVVSLSGVVESSAAKWAAERAASRVGGVEAIAVGIEVRLPGSDRRTDGEIAGAVANALEWNTWLHGLDLHVRVEHGWVTFEGTSDWEFQRREAERVARHTCGVEGVSNLIEVRPRPVEHEQVREKTPAAMP